MEKLKRTISMLLCIALLLSCVPGVIFASEDIDSAYTEPVAPVEEPRGEDLAAALSLPASGGCPACQ